MPPRKVNNILELVGDTPLVRVNRLWDHPKVELYAKVEYMNPGGSVKDRVALSMIEAAERSGELTPGKTILEATSGNTGIGLAMVAAVKGYKAAMCLSESASEERKKILRAYGAELILTPGHLGTDGAIEEAYRLAREEPDKYFCPDQFNNQFNWRAHYDTTADEIYQATEGKVRVVVITMGTTGTLMGICRRMRELDPKVRVVGVEPYLGHKIQGLKNMKESMVPGIFARREPDEIVNIDDEQAYECARRLAREEGIFVGMSAGAAMKVALDEAARLAEGVVVALLPDGGERYLSTSLFASEKVPEPLKFFNSLTRQVEDLNPVKPGRVGIYCCGPSLDGPADLSLCRRMVFADLVRRYLESRRFEVTQVINLADIDDRTVKECLKTGLPLPEFTARWLAMFHQDMDTLNVLPAHQHPRASEHVEEMVAATEQLLAKGVAYEKLKSVYFNISKFKAYGRLSGMNMESIMCAAATEDDSYEKENACDFSLFKRTNLAELKAGIYWRTPWGNARPGWHVECSTMSRSALGQPFDLHIASTDLIFPHGDNEIAIAESLSGKPLANMWLHCEVAMSGGKKISRAAGNALTLRDLLAAGHSPAAVRYWLLNNHYRHDNLEYSPEALLAAEHTVARLREFVARLHFHTPGTPITDLDQTLFDTRRGYQEAMDGDLNVPQAMGFIFAFMKKVNKHLAQGLLDGAQAAKTLEAMDSLDKVLGVIDYEYETLGPELLAQVNMRERARQAKNWAEADRIRDYFLEKGIELIDTATGTRWRKTSF